jgi:adenosylmethionine-8-amino-7-oxononanoate aminotransferase
VHFKLGEYGPDSPVPVIVRGEGAYIYDAMGKRYLDALAGPFVNQLGYGRTELAEVATKQASELAFFPLWSYAHPTAIELAVRIAGYAPGELNRVFFTSGGREAVETAWKLAKQFFKLTGKPGKHKVISRAVAYHGTTQGGPRDRATEREHHVGSRAQERQDRPQPGSRLCGTPARRCC